MAARPETSKRQALLDGALACFLEHGVVETTMEHVLSRSGASVGSLYHHFGGKEGLADALYVECLGGYHTDAAARLDAAPDAEAGVRAIVEHHLGWIVEHTDRAKFLLAYRDHEIRPASDELRSLNRVFYGQIERWITDRATVELPPLPVVISQWLGPTHSFSRHWLSAQVRITPGDAGPFLSDSAWHALGPLFRPTVA
jgi:AcrR family transcriptional regulator